MFHPGKDFFPFFYLNLSSGLNVISFTSVLCEEENKQQNNKRGCPTLTIKHPWAEWIDGGSQPVAVAWMCILMCPRVHMSPRGIDRGD